MTQILGTLTDSAGTPLSGELEITLDAPLIDASTTPDTILLPRSKVIAISAGAIALNLPQSETSNLTYHFRFNTFAEVIEFYFQNGDSYTGPTHQHSDSQWYTGNSHTSDSLLLSRYVQRIPTQIFDFHTIIPNQSSVEFASLLPTGISTDVLDTSIRRLAQLLTSNADYATALRGGPNFKGIYSISAYYQLGDAVVHGGGAWIYVQATPTTGSVPSSNSTFWQPFIPSIQLDAQKIGTVATIADLKAIAIPQGTLTVLGYYAPGDGGGGTFTWDALSSDGDNGGTIIAKITGGSGRWKRTYEQGFVNALWFGAKRVETGGIESDAPTNVTAFNKALLVADTFVPAGLYWTVINKKASETRGSDATQVFPTYDGIKVPQGRTLFGECAQSTILKARSNAAAEFLCSMIIVDSDATVRDLQIDGNRTNISSVLKPTFQCFTIWTAPISRTNITFKNLIIHDCPNTTTSSESFALSLYTAKNCRVSNIRCYNNSTGLHFDGNYLDGILGSDNIVENSVFYDSVWMGLSTYGAKNLIVKDCEFYNNRLNGLNIEWTDNIHAEGIKSHNNGRGGIVIHGYTTNGRIYNSDCYDNADPNIGDGGEQAEIILHDGHWHTGTPEPQATNGVIELHNVSLRPRSTSYHIRAFKELTPSSLPTIGYSQNERILINCPGAENWRYNKSAPAADQSSPNFGHGFKFPSLKPSALQFYLTDWYNWAKNSPGITTTNYTGTGNFSKSAKTTTSTVQNAHFKQLLPKGKYLIKFRYTNPSATKWNIKIGLDNGSQALLIGNLARTTADINRWFECEYIVDVPDDAQEWYLKLICFDSASSASLVVDYLTIEELSAIATIPIIETANGNLKVYGSAYNTAHLILGNYHFWIDSAGKLRIKNGVPVSDTDGNLVGS